MRLFNYDQQNCINERQDDRHGDGDEQSLAKYPKLAKPLKKSFAQHEAMQRAATGSPNVHREEITVSPLAQPPDEFKPAPVADWRKKDFISAKASFDHHAGGETAGTMES